MYSTTLSPILIPSTATLTELRDQPDFSAMRHRGFYCKSKEISIFATKSVSLLRTIIAPTFAIGRYFDKTTPHLPLYRHVIGDCLSFFANYFDSFFEVAFSFSRASAIHHTCQSGSPQFCNICSIYCSH